MEGMYQLLKHVYLHSNLSTKVSFFLVKVSFGLYSVYSKPYENFKFWHTYVSLSLFTPYTIYRFFPCKRLWKNIKNWPHFSFLQFCCSNRYVITIATISNRFIQNLFLTVLNELPWIAVKWYCTTIHTVTAHPISEVVGEVFNGEISYAKVSSVQVFHLKCLHKTFYMGLLMEFTLAWNTLFFFYTASTRECVTMWYSYLFILADPIWN